jgi:formylglycine-generating enzyme required for sulfatase activity
MRTTQSILLILACFALSGGEAAAQSPATQPAAQPAAAAGDAAIIEKLPGTLVEFALVRLPGDPPVWMSSTEVTWDLYDVFAYSLDLSEQQRAEGVDAKSRPSKPYGAPDRGYGHQGYPAIGVAHHAAEEFCRWLSGKTGHRYRLPTEAEWDRACVGGVTSPPASVRDVAWYDLNALGKTHPVGKKKPSALGLFDMLGNAAEWCRTADGGYVVRGGSFLDAQRDVTSAARAEYNESWQESDPQDPKSQWWLSDAPHVGFRIVRED